MLRDEQACLRSLRSRSPSRKRSRRTKKRGGPKWARLFLHFKGVCAAKSRYEGAAVAAARRSSRSRSRTWVARMKAALPDVSPRNANADQ